MEPSHAADPRTDPYDKHTGIPVAMSHAEIAREMGISEANARMLCSRAERHFHRQLRRLHGLSLLAESHPDCK